jgi:hypothetical protein
MEHDELSKLIDSFRDSQDLATFRRNLLSRPALTIGKVLNRKRGDPDYVIKGKGWDVWVDHDKVRIRMEPYTGRQQLNTDTEGMKPLLDLLGSKGSASMAMLYMELLDPYHLTYQIKDFPDLSIQRMAKFLVHFILYEPHKIKWVDFLPLS